MNKTANSWQRTIAERVTIKGIGLHTGTESIVTLHPASEDAGIFFASNGDRVQAISGNVVGTARGTTLGFNGAKVATVEHLMAALSGLGVDNVCVEVRGSEMPALDGSALPYVEAISRIGTVAQTKRRKTGFLREPISVVRGDSFLLAVPAEDLRITYILNYDHPLIGRQSATFVVTEASFSADIAPARTFVVYEDIAGLVSRDLARGGSISNAIVLWQDRFSSELRFPDELVRHKVLDLIGDLALVGQRMGADIVAVKSGHALNVEFAGLLASHLSMLEPQEAA